MTTVIHLRNFADDELLFTEEETRDVLIFFFPSQESATRNVEITNQHKNFAQGLLVAAIDATCAIRTLRDIFSGAYMPANSMRSALSKLGQAGAKQWFAYATEKDLVNAKISETIRRKMSLQFGTEYKIILEAKVTPFFHAIYIHPFLC